MPEGARARIVVLATGGTIAGVEDGAATVGYTAGALSAEQLLRSIAPLAGRADIRAEQVANVGSQNMTHEVWWKLLGRIEALAADPLVDAMVITHGTDTLEETAYFLSLAANRAKPVVLVGAMRPATSLSADGPRNLYNAIAAAETLQGRSPAYGPLVVMNDTIYTARDVRKTASTGVCAFAAANGAPAGAIENGVAWLRPAEPAPRGAAVVLAPPCPPAQWPRVEIVYAHAGMGGEVIDFLAGRAQGIVLAGVGDGNATDQALAALERAARSGVAIVRATRTGSGRVSRNGELDDDALGFVAAGDLSPQKARVLLMLALMRESTAEKLQALFALN